MATGRRGRGAVNAAVFYCLAAALSLASGEDWTDADFRDRLRQWANSGDLDDPQGRLDSWRDEASASVCDFAGVQCIPDELHQFLGDFDEDAIKEIDLAGFGLSGALPGWVWAAAKDSLQLSHNHWNATTTLFDESMTGAALSRARRLNCTDCGLSLSGRVFDGWEEFVNLRALDLSLNPDLEAEFPAGLGVGSELDLRFEGTPICGASPVTGEPIAVCAS